MRRRPRRRRPRRRRPGAAPFDVVVGNPPYLNQLAAGHQPAAVARAGAAALRRHGRAVPVARPCTPPGPTAGGSGSCCPTRSWPRATRRRSAPPALAGARLDSLWWAGERGVRRRGAHVRRRRSCGASRRRPCAGPTGQRFDAAARRRRRTICAARPTWSHLVADAAGIPTGAARRRRRPRPIWPRRRPTSATSTTGSSRHVTDAGDGPPLVTVRAPRRRPLRVGRAAGRFARRSFAAPRVDVAALPPALQAWATGRLVPKVLVATQTRVIEAVVDPSGRVAAVGPGDHGGAPRSEPTCGGSAPCCARRRRRRGRRRPTSAPRCRPAPSSSARRRC